MGSNQSAPTSAPAPSSSIQPQNDALPADKTTAGATAKSKKEKPNLTGIDAVNYRCRKKKATYDKCVSNWYNERFLQGKSIDQEEECGVVFEIYRQCYLKGIKREFFDKGNKAPKEGSLLAEELDE